MSQQDTTTSINVDLINIFNQKQPKKYKVSKITVVGNKYFDETLLTSIANIAIGDEVTIPGGDIFSKAINKLWAQSYFSNVEIYITNLKGKEIDIEIAVTERARLANFHIVGVSKGNEDDLRGKMGLVRGKIVTENNKQIAIDVIKNYFSEKGFERCKVTIVPVQDSLIANSISLNFIVDKGSKVKIDNIAFEGNTDIESSVLKKKMKDTKEKGRLTLFPPKNTGGFITPKTYTFNDYLKEKGYLYPSLTKKLLDPFIRIKPLVGAKFDPKKYAEDKESIIAYYNSIGYRDAAIIKDTTYYNQGKMCVDEYGKSYACGDKNIDIKINEGHRYYFGKITWKGNTKYADSILNVVLGIKKGDIYSLETLNKKLGKGGGPPEGGDISGLYMDDGYLFFRSEAVETAVYNDTIDHEIRLVEGPQAVWKEVKIVGNDKTKEHVIRRELRTIPGEKFVRSDVIRTVRELSQLSFFNPEKIVPNIVPNPEDGTVNVTWQVEEKSSDQLELSAGWGGNIGLTGTLGMSFNNFSINRIFHKDAWDPLPMGDGQKLSFRIQSNGRAFRSYNFSFTEPWLGGKKRNPFSISFYDTKFANAYDPLTGQYTSAAANNSYIQTTGGGISIGKQLKWPDDYFSLSVGINFARYKLKNYYIDRVNLPGFNNGFSHNLSIKVALQRSSIDNPMFPRSGSNMLWSLAATPPYSLFDKSIVTQENPYKWIEYYKTRFNAEWYIPLTKAVGEDHKQLVLKAAAKFGFLGRYNSKLNISPFERFQVGDAGLTNQFALLGYDIIAHRGYPVYQSSDPKINPEQSGASQYFTMFNKYQLELRYPLSLNPSSTIYAVGFFEAANGWYDVKDYNPFKLRRSVGVGMRFFLPMFGLLGFDYGIGLDRYTEGAKIKDMSRFTFMLGFEAE
ncbi:MAG: BamA/TamA family outer membrane protein [Bacteroidetes bacterium]|nr:BamA/TamA family outer membrane protein [Bacteroidota bacterium]